MRIKRSDFALAITLGLAGTTGAVHAQLAQESIGEPANQATSTTSLPLFNYAIGLGYRHTDNVDRVASDPTSQDMLQPTLNFTYTQQGSSLQTQIAGVVQYVDYLEGFYGDEFRGQLSADVNWTIAPQRLNFVLQDYSSVEPVSTRAANAPSNQQQVNVLVAGPTLTFGLGANSAWQGQADLRYINTTASKTKDFNSQRGLLALRTIRALTPTDSLSLDAEAEGVRFDNVNPTVAATRYDKYSIYARYQSHLAHIDLDVALGGSRVSFSQGWPGHSGPLARVSLSWRVDPRNVIQFSAANQLADATADLVQPPQLGSFGLTDPNVAIGRTVISPAVFRDRNFNINYTYDGARLGVSVNPYYAQLRQLNGVELSRNGYGAIVGLTYQINPLTTLDASVGDQTTKYLVDGSHDRDQTASIGLSRMLTPHWSWSATLLHDRRRSSRFGYTDNEVLFFVYYRR